MRLYEVGPFGPQHLSQDERLEMLRRYGREAEMEFQALYPAIQDWFTTYDAPYLLAHCVFYFLTHPEGTDPEARGRLKIYPHYVEIMQAFALTVPRKYSPKPLLHEVATLQDQLSQIGQLMLRRLFDLPADVTTLEQVERYRLRTEMMAHTAAVRNWAYHHQMRRVTTDLAATIQRDFQDQTGLDPVRLVDVLFGIGDLVTERLNAHVRRLATFVRKTSARTMVEAYGQAFPDTVPMTPEQADVLSQRVDGDINGVRAMLMAHSDLRLAEVLSVSLKDLGHLYGDDTKVDDLARLMGRLSLTFGDLATHDIRFFVLGNPTHSKPFIEISPGVYFTALHGLLPHLALSLLEGLIAETTFRADYSDRRSRYLERRVEALARAGFPHGQVLANGKWTDPQTGEIYENDVVVVIDEFLLVLECKSGVVTPPARRGAPDRLVETLRRLIEDPSEQAFRLIQTVKSSAHPIALTNDAGQTLTLDPKELAYYIPVGVTLEHLGSISSNLKKLIRAGVTTRSIVDLAPSVSLCDLECIFGLLTLEAETVHYFARRREIEKHVEYEADEMDLLAFYLDTGFNLGADEFSQRLAFMLSGKSRELNNYFIGTAEGRPIAKPTTALTEWWRDILVDLTSRTPPKWLAVSYVLLGLSHAQQATFEKQTRRLQRRVEKRTITAPPQWLEFKAGPPERRMFVAGFPYRVADRSERDRALSAIIDVDAAREARGSVVIGLDVTTPRYPYSVLAGSLETSLFS